MTMTANLPKPVSKHDKTPRFSIVVPACCVGPYIDRTIDSLKNQTCGDFEVLLVCEESDDDTLARCRTAAANDLRFQVVGLPRSGSASASRNYGIRHASGEYLLFVDGDDWIRPEALRVFSEVVERMGRVDVIMSGATMYFQQDDNTIVEGGAIENPIPSDRVFTGVEIISRVYPLHCLRPATWMRVYRREFLLDHQLFQIVGRRHQDDEWTPRVFFFAEKVVGCDYRYYCYRKRAESVTTDGSVRSIYDQAANARSFFDFWYAHRIPDELKRELATFFCDILFCFYLPGKIAAYPFADRERAFLGLVGAADDFRRYVGIARRSRFSKRLMIFIVALGRMPHCFGLSQRLFTHVYYPLIFTCWNKLKSHLHRR